jgi:hypothetical protein
MLLPGLTPLWRGPRTLQLGLDPRRAVVLDLPNPAAAGVLDLLDGVRTEAAVLAAAARRGIGEHDARTLLDALRRHRLVAGAHTFLPRTLGGPARRRLAAEAAALALGRLTRAPAPATVRPPDSALQPDSAPPPDTAADVLRRRLRARVRVTGRGRLGLPIAIALAAAGIGHLEPALSGQVEPGEFVPAATADEAPKPGDRAVLAARTIAALAPGTRVHPLGRPDDATFVVQVGPPVGPVALYALAHRRVPHLAVGLRDGTAVIGPLVVPGGRPCLNCLELHRADRDPAWPALAAQLGTPDAGGPWTRGTATEACAAATALIAAGYAVATVLRHVDGDPPQPPGSTLEIANPTAVRRRTWDPHPACDCTRRRRSATRRK